MYCDDKEEEKDSNFVKSVNDLKFGLYLILIKNKYYFFLKKRNFGEEKTLFKKQGNNIN